MKTMVIFSVPFAGASDHWADVVDVTRVITDKHLNHQVSPWV